MENPEFDPVPDSFIELSGILTGYNNLNPQLAEEYYNALKNLPQTGIDALLTEYETKISDQLPVLKTNLVQTLLWNDANFKDACVYIINLWYTSVLSINKVQVYTGSPKAYYEALFPKLAHAHPVALSGGYHGYWHYPPEN